MSSATEHNFSAALSTWRSIHLSELQKTLDAQGIELVDNQKESLVGRKALADKTKEFKKISDEEKLTAFKGLLKAYQTEIDNLTKRAKAAESAFLNVYKVLAEAPDPYPLLEVAVDQTVKVAEAHELELELERFREENADLRKRINELSGIESAKKKAEAKVEQLDHRMEELIQERVVQKETELNALYDERIRNYEEREQDLHRQVSLAKQQLRDLRTSHDSNQAKLLDHSQRQDQEVVAKLAEVDMIVADLERANSRVATVERRNESLRAEIENMRAGGDTSDQVKTLHAQIQELEVELERLNHAAETLKNAHSQAESAGRKKIEELSKDLQNTSAEIGQLRNRLKKYSDYDEIKRELEIMKYVEFAGFEEDGDEIDKDSEALRLPNPNAEKANAHQARSLEALLATKNKRIQEELTKFRILHNELEASLQYTEDQLSLTRSELEKQRVLNEKLETDLLSLNQHKANGAASSEPSNLLVGLEIGGHKDSSSRAPASFAPSADTSILPIVTSQRDRFRQRNAELEEELRKQYNIISELRAEIKNLQSDNLKLYEKVRYMQSYREDSGSRPVSQLDPLPPPSSGGTDDMGKYRTRYEEAMNPFEAFRGREATRAYQNLNPVDRAVLTITRAILGNRRARTFLIFYTFALHLLVIFTSYECTSSGPALRKPSGP